MKRPQRQGYNFTVTIPELFYLLFKKKECPKCGGKMFRYKTYTVKLQRELKNKWRGDMYMTPDPNQEIKVYKYSYECTVCNSTFPLSELVNKKVQ
ncbi:MAG: hypothetical protein FWE05_13325 [Defluviitaleaceae bacterium]|nr:hypothetical protein [Defluviitaleaceae bacterium]